jgi:acyl carrier protein
MIITTDNITAIISKLVMATAEDWDDDQTIGPSSLLIRDFGFASIDFVQLVVDIEEAFGQKLGFQDLLMPDGKYVDDLSLQSITEFVEARLTPCSDLLSSDQVSVIQPDPLINIQELPSSERLSHERINEFRSLIPKRTPQQPVKKNPQAIFVLSPPRCGSTLLRVILAGHPALFAPPELHLLMYDNLSQRRQALARPSTDYLLEGTVRALMQLRQCSAQTALDQMSLFEDYDLNIHDFYNQIQKELGDRRLVDKTPSYALSIDVLNRAETYFEDPIFIHLLRHPYGAIRSYEDAKLERLSLPFLSLSDDLDIFTRREFAELMWTVSHENIVEFLKTIPSHRQRQIKFEDMVLNPRDTMAELCKFIDITFYQDILALYDNKAHRMTDGVQTVSRMGGDLKFFLHKGIDADAAFKWQRYHNSDFLGDRSWQMAEILGYCKG